LRILNFLAAPFGSQEALLLEYGIKGTDFNFDDKGNPVPTEKGLQDTAVTWKYLAAYPPVLFDPNDQEFPKVAYADSQAMVPYLIADPTVGLYSETGTSKGGQLTQKFSDGLGEIVRGQSPLTALDQLIKDWRANGGEQMRAEYQKAYAESK